MTTTAMLSHQNVVEIVHSLYLSKRESRCRMPSQFGAGGSLWTEWHHGFEVCVHILRSLTTIKEGDWILLLFLLILFAGTETRLYDEMVVINGTLATADIYVKVISLCWVRK